VKIGTTWSLRDTITPLRDCNPSVETRLDRRKLMTIPHMQTMSIDARQLPQLRNA